MKEIMKKHVNIEIFDEDELVFLNGGASAAGAGNILKGIKDFIDHLNVVCGVNGYCPIGNSNHNCPCHAR